MATEFLDPNGDIAANWSLDGGGPLNSDNVNKGVRTPTVPAVNDVESNSDAIDEYSMSTETVGEVSSIKLWIYANNNDGGESATADIYVNGSYTGSPVDFNVAGGGFAWYSVEFIDTYDQADIDALQVKMTQVSGGNNRTTVRALYSEVTHGGGASGGHKIIGGELL